MAQGRQTYCEHGDRTVLIFVDRTTAYDEVDKRIFVEGFDRIMSRLRVGDAVYVQTIGGEFTESEIVFNQCLPGCPDEGLVNWLFGTCKAVIARGDLAQFRAELANSVKQLLDHPESYKQSDIARTITSVSRTHSARARTSNGSPIGLVFVFSDLLENSAVVPWGLLASKQNEAALREIQQADLAPDLNGSEIAAFGFGRSHNAERSSLSPTSASSIRKFWEAYFRLGGASNIYIGQYLN